MSDKGKFQSLSGALNMGHGQASPPPLPQLNYPKVEGLWFHKKVLKLDGWNFEGCRFDGCKLIIETPYFVIKNCYIDESNSVELVGSLMNAVRFLNIKQHNAGNIIFWPIKNFDGTVSIGA